MHSENRFKNFFATLAVMTLCVDIIFVLMYPNLIFCISLTSSGFIFLTIAALSSCCHREHMQTTTTLPISVVHDVENVHTETEEKKIKQQIDLPPSYNDLKTYENI